MAGKPRKRIDYAGWSVDIFSNDPKIDKLLDAQGWIGFGIYFYLCQMAFGGEGYFYEWCYDLCATTARKMGGGVSAGTVKETVDYCLQIGLFDKWLFDRWGVLTSRGIQKSYLVVLKSKNRKGTEIIKEYWLLDISQERDYQGVIFIHKNSQLLGENDNKLGDDDDLLEENDHPLEQKESKVKESKDACVTRASRFNDFFTAYPKQKNMVAAEKEYMLLLLNDQSLGEQDLVNAAVNYAEAVSILGTEERYIKNPDRFLSEGRYMDYLDANYKKPDSRKKSKPKKNKFNDFAQREYDMSDLESKLLGNGGDVGGCRL